MAREELTKARDAGGQEYVISVVSVEEAGIPALAHPTFTLWELAAYADELEGDEHPIHQALAQLLLQQVGRAAATVILYEIAAFGGLSALAQAFPPQKDHPL